MLAPNSVTPHAADVPKSGQAPTIEEVRNNLIALVDVRRIGHG
jgi:hypothetical protein